MENVAAFDMPSATIRVIAAVISDGDRLLVCQRPPHKRHGGLWEFPGGKCEGRESDLEAARRELHEELGVEVLSVGRAEVEIHDEGSPFMIAFVPVAVQGVATPHEHTGMFWGTPEDLLKLPLAPSDRRFVEQRIRNGSA